MKKKLLLVVVSAALLYIYFTFDPAVNSFFPRCPLFTFTGLYCPGCGSQRAVHHILKGKIAAAAGLNLLVPLYLPLIVVYYTSYLVNATQLHRKLVVLLNKKWFIYGSLLIIVLFGVFRNTQTEIGKYLAP